MNRTKWSKLVAALALSGALVACGDDDAPMMTPDAGTDAGNADVDGGHEEHDAGGGDTDAGTDAGMEDLPEPVVIPLSATGHDRLYGVTYDSAGNIYATGQIAVDDSDFALVVAKFTPAGALDTTFDDDGIAQVNVAVGGGAAEVARGIVVQSTGRIVIAGTAESDPTIGEDGDYRRGDTDVVLVGFTASGEVDETFGTDGIARVDLNQGTRTEDASGNDVLSGADTQWSLSLASSDRLVVHGTQRAEGEGADGNPRSDSVFALIRLTADGELDDTFSDDGIVTVDLVGDPTTGNITADRAGARLSARSASVLPDGSIIGSGYLTSTLLVTAPMTTQQPVIYKVDADGELDDTFATTDATTLPGVWHDLAVAPPLRAEAYGAALQGTDLVTMGYGPTNGEGSGTDIISLRYTSAGELDDSYGTDGATYVDVGGLGDNGRAVLVLEDGRVVGLGGGRPAPASGAEPEVDAVVVVLTEDGAPDTSFAANGFRSYDLADTDFFWGGALSPDGSTVAIVGVAGSSEGDDDAVLFLLPTD